MASDGCSCCFDLRLRGNVGKDFSASNMNLRLLQQFSVPKLPASMHHHGLKVSFLVFGSMQRFQ